MYLYIYVDLDSFLSDYEYPEQKIKLSNSISKNNLLYWYFRIATIPL